MVKKEHGLLLVTNYREHAFMSKLDEMHWKTFKADPKL